MRDASAWACLGRELRLACDADQIDALQSERAEAWARVAAADFLTLNEKRAAVGYEPVAGGDMLAQGGKGSIAV